MSVFHETQAFVRAANAAVDFGELRRLVIGVVKTLGFDHVALVTHVRLFGARQTRLDLIEYPQAWQDQQVRQGYFYDDPVITACQTSAAAFKWSDVGTRIQLTERQAEILRRARDHGMGEGFTVPISVPGQFLGSFSFSTRQGQPLPEESLPAAQYIACFAFEAARRIQSKVQGSNRVPPLSPRQHACILLAAQGKSDGVIGEILGISPLTAHQHIEQAKKRYGVATRQQLIVRALFDNQITFGDIL